MISQFNDYYKNGRNMDGLLDDWGLKEKANNLISPVKTYVKSRVPTKVYDKLSSATKKVGVKLTDSAKEAGQEFAMKKIDAYTSSKEGQDTMIDSGFQYMSDYTKQVNDAFRTGGFMNVVKTYPILSSVVGVTSLLSSFIIVKKLVR